MTERGRRARGFDNPAIPWSELERRLSGRPAGDGAAVLAPSTMTVLQYVPRSDTSCGTVTVYATFASPDGGTTPFVVESVIHFAFDRGVDPAASKLDVPSAEKE